MTKIGYAQATFHRDIELTKECIERVSPFVDVTIISYDQSVTNSQLEWFNNNKEKYNVSGALSFKKNSNNLQDRYIKNKLTSRCNLSFYDIPNELIEVKRLQLKLYRLIKELG